MNRTLTSLAVIFLGLMGLTACAADGPLLKPKDAPASAAPQESTAPAPEETAEKTPSMPDGARPASAAFPFPVPEDWPELMPFTEEKIGKSIAMSAAYGFPDDAESAATTYRQLLEKAGYTIHPNPLGEQVHAASFIVEGSVDAVGYSGGLDFDANAEGEPRVMINLTKK